MRNIFRAAVPHSPSAVWLPIRSRAFSVNLVSVTLFVVFLCGAAFYLWTAGSTYPLELNGAQGDPYNLLAGALLHFHLSIGPAPAALVHLQDPYDPTQNAPFQPYFHDLALYHGRFYLTWGPAPVLVLLVPLHILGLEPSPSLTVALFATAGLGFVLATLNALVRQVGNVRLWMCLLAACTLTLSTAVPFILRRPAVYEEAIAGGFCFAMAGIWLVASALVDHKASLPRLLLMSLCFGLAAGSRPTLGLTALVLVPIYMAQRPTRGSLKLLIALAGPVSVCLLLLLAYNQARFGGLLEFGTKYQLASENANTAPYGNPIYVPPGAWFYMIAPPRPIVLFPFIQFAPSLVSYPLGVPANYVESEAVGGLLPMTPIVLFLPALPWIWRRRSAVLGSLAAALLILSGAGVAIILFLSYEFFAATERYEVDFTTLFLLGSLAAWFALSTEARGVRRRLARVGGCVLAIWGCLTGLAVSFTGYYNLLAVNHPSTWEALQNAGLPLSKAITSVVGQPVLAQVSTPTLERTFPTYTDTGVGAAAFWLGADVPASLTVLSPDAREASLVADVSPGRALAAGVPRGILLDGPGSARASYRLPAHRAVVNIPVHLDDGMNRLVLSPLLGGANGTGNPATSGTQPLLLVWRLSLAPSPCPSRRSPCP
jgi:hypothetical protein